MARDFWFGDVERAAVQRTKLASSLRKKYESGASIRTIATTTGLSYASVRKMLIESGVTLRGRGAHAATTASQFEELVQRGVISAPRAKGRRPVPTPAHARGGLSDIVLAQRS
jgi:hypothetical protein